jgi:hypothetical protein
MLFHCLMPTVGWFRHSRRMLQGLAIFVCVAGLGLWWGLKQRREFNAAFNLLVAHGTMANRGARNPPHDFILAMGAKVVPYLLSEVTAQPSRIDQFIEEHPAIGKWLGDRYSISLVAERRAIAQMLMWQVISSGVYPVEEVSRLLRNDLDERRRSYGLTLLGLMGQNGSNCIPKLIELVNSAEPLASQAASVYAKVAPPLDSHLADIRAAIRRKKITASHGITILNQLGAPVRGFIPDLGEELCAAKDEQRFRTLMAFKETKDSPELMAPFLMRAYDTSEPRLRAAFLDAFAQCGHGAVEAIPLITRALDDEWYYVRSAAARALQKIGVGSPEILAALSRMRSDPNAEVAEAATEAHKVLHVTSR